MSDRPRQLLRHRPLEVGRYGLTRSRLPRGSAGAVAASDVPAQSNDALRASNLFTATSRY